VFHLGCFSESRLEGWLSIPNRTNIKRYGWKKQVCFYYYLFLIWRFRRTLLFIEVWNVLV